MLFKKIKAVSMKNLLDIIKEWFVSLNTFEEETQFVSNEIKTEFTDEEAEEYEGE